MKVKEARALIGKLVEWEYDHDYKRGTCAVDKGTIQEIKGRNILISGVWYWLPNLINLKLHENETK